VSADATQAALRRYTRRALGTIAIGLVAVIAGGSVMELSGYPDREGVAVQAGGWLGIAGFVTAVYGMLWALNALRIRRCLRRNPWQIWPCRFDEIPGNGMAPNGSPTLVLLGGPDDEQPVLGIVSINTRWRKLDPATATKSGSRGTQPGGGVAAPPGGSLLLWARRPRLASSREARRRHTLERPTVQDLRT
jgi:hypothetical protein